ncbi:serine/threonine-protein kinase [Lacipirellula limnantheis]|uniref:Serine/threonine-protein kinase PknB n=1 Tax=Lacipirellula limnantheis TaxID=2528024 RepID=A0A517TYE6_9BACT|nr:serine/threonine-protein kinase [Lacipirellula limnantheis]QDT73403.1 Serine/threonine-protein kinase PknB [Lacipirellula limnantheis]
MRATIPPNPLPPVTPIPADEESIFIAALDLPDERERSAYLDQSCRENPALRRQIELLLSAFGEGQFLESPAAGVAVARAPAPVSEKPGSTIGPYKLLEQIGEGGMGLVFMAEQTRPLRRRVALKVIKPGLDTRSVIARFEAERQALALMDHPNIARVYDAGATEGRRPYFVMELVRGAPITDYCNERGVGLRDRLELFIKVCEAVQHAHQKGVIHRDLKPTNILVSQTDTAPLPKVIDFGVAKATSQQLTERTLFTNFAQIVGTPLYMSPEQADLDNQDVDTRSDVYSLGVVLYELLTGVTPFDGERLRSVGQDEMRRIIREEEPPRPSTRATTVAVATTAAAPQSGSRPTSAPSALRGELDWIVMKALEKDRRRRYDSASGLAADVRRYLDHEPVEAAAPSLIYLARKFVRRHRGRVALGALLLAVCAMGIVGLGISTIAIADSLDQTKAAERQAAQDRDQFRSERDRAEANLYVADVRLAHEEWKQAHVAATTRLLNAHLPQPGERDLRGWEWHYLAGLSQRGSVVLGDTTGQFRAAAWSPDGRRLATSDENHQIKTWDAVTLRELRTFRGHADFISWVEWSPEGRHIASADNLGIVRIWDVETGTSSTIEASKEPIRCVAWSPDGKQLASCGNGEVVKVWDADSHKELRQVPGHTEIAWRVAWSPDGRRLASIDNAGTIRVCEVESGNLLSSRPEAHTWPVLTIAWSPDGKNLATGAGDSLVRIWDVDSWESRNLAGHRDEVTSVRWSPDGSMLASSSADGSIVLWDDKTGAPLHTLRGHADAVREVRWSPDGRRLASASWDGAVRIWDAAGQQEYSRFNAESYAAWSPDGRQFAALASPARGVVERTLQMFDAATSNPVGEPIKLLSADGPFVDWFPEVAWSPNGGMIAVAFSTQHQVGVNIVDIATRAELTTFTLATSARQPEVRSVAFSPDASMIAAAILGGQSRVVAIWDVASGQQLAKLPTPENVPDSLAWSPDGTRLATTTFDGFVKIWNTATWQEAMQLDRQPQDRRVGTGGPHLVCWNSNGSALAAGTVAGRVVIWDAATGRDVLSFSAHAGKIATVAWSPDNSRLATVGSDKLAKIWNAATGAHLLTLGGNGVSVRDAAWSPDGEHLLTSGESGHYIWSAPGAARRGRK